MVEPGRLRFDFTHYAAMDRAEIEEVERLMNDEILKNIPSKPTSFRSTRRSPRARWLSSERSMAKRFGSSTVPGFSRELCGGTHVGRTGDIGVCKIVYEGSISAGVRRIEAITGEAALRQYQESTDSLRRVAGLLKASEPELIDHVEKLLAKERTLEKQIEHLKSKQATAKVQELIGGAGGSLRPSRGWPRPQSDALRRGRHPQSEGQRRSRTGLRGRWRRVDRLRRHRKTSPPNSTPANSQAPWPNPWAAKAGAAPTWPKEEAKMRPLSMVPC